MQAKRMRPRTSEKLEQRALGPQTDSRSQPAWSAPVYPSEVKAIHRTQGEDKRLSIPTRRRNYPPTPPILLNLSFPLKMIPSILFLCSSCYFHKL